MSQQPRAVGRATRVRLPLLACLVLALLCAVAPTSAVAEEVYIFRGRGNGHGVGMSQYGALGFAQKGFGYRHILSHYYQGTSITVLPEAHTMRVAVQRTDAPAQSWSFTTHDAPMLVDWSHRASAPFITLDRGARYRFSIVDSGPDVTITNVSTGQVVHTLQDVAWVRLCDAGTTGAGSTGLTRVHEASGPFSRTDLLYQGWISLVRGSGANAGRLHLRNLVQLEDYVRCVVPREMPASWHPEALKAQAVAARTYAYASRNALAEFDVWCTVSSQVYNGWGQWVNGRAVRHNEVSPGVGGDWLGDSAVDGTRAQIATYDGEPIKAFFFSTSGGYTEHSEYVWSAALPYTRAVPDPFEYLAGSSTHTLDDIVLTSSEVRTRLLAGGFGPSDLPAVISGIRVLERGASGRVRSLQLYGVSGDDRVISDVRRFRTAVSSGRWNTTWFYINPKTERVAGSDRHATSVEVSKRAFASASNVVLVGGRAPVDALSASAFAASLPGGAPILLTDRASLTPSVKEEIRRLNASRVYIIGGTLAVGSAVESDLRSIPALQASGSIERIGGATRYETASMLAESVLAAHPGSRVFVVSGEKVADALAVSPVAYAGRIPIVPVRQSSVPTESAWVLDRPEITSTLVVGGEFAVGDAVLPQLPAPTRIAEGADRYDTAARVAAWASANEGFLDTTTYVASGVSLVDALAAAPLIGKGRCSVLFAHTHTLPLATTDALAARRDRVAAVRMLGGEGALGNGVEASIERALD